MRPLAEYQLIDRASLSPTHSVGAFPRECPRPNSPRALEFPILEGAVAVSSSFAQDISSHDSPNMVAPAIRPTGDPVTYSPSLLSHRTGLGFALVSRR
jgi:hypothetical protein